MLMPVSRIMRSPVFISWALIFVLPFVVAAQPKGSGEKIRITYAANNLGFLQMFLAKDRGFYAAQGLETELIRVSPVVAVSALISGDSDYTELLTSSTRAAAKGAPIRVVSMSLSAPFFSLVARPQYKAVKDLKGATIGVNAIGGSNYISTRMLLLHYGVDPERDVKMLPLGDHKTLYEALKLGRVDAVTVNPPFSVLLMREAFPLLAHSAKIVSFPIGGVATTLRKINQNRDQVKRVLRAEMEALRYLRQQPQGTIDVISNRFAIEPAVAAESYKIAVDAFNDGRILFPAMDRLLDADKRDGAIDKSVTVDQVADASLAEEVFKELGRGR
ncbi:MAG TPA: ABC transporter substrate-binding protein [Candidatus Binatia bacterium]|nr:ABC transporter substrate-binding protein [Candidatus Binatia bacterium]